MYASLLNRSLFSLLLSLIVFSASAQLYDRETWSRDGNSLYENSDTGISEYSLTGKGSSTLINSRQLTPAGQSGPLHIKNFFFSPDYKKVLIFTNAKKVWRYETRGDYWVYDKTSGSLKQLGKSLPASSLMFAKISPDGMKAAYVSGHNIYVEDLSTNKIKALTSNGSRKMINGTFDWVYEEELNCRDGFRWSPDSRAIAYWQINDSTTRDYYMLNTTDSVYSRVIPVEYPISGQMPSPFKIGVVQISSGKTNWMKIPTDLKNGTYLPRMEWAASNEELIIERLNRNQNESDVMLCNTKSGDVKGIP